MSKPHQSRQEESEEERVYIQDCSFENNTYRVGDFVYVEPSESKLQPHIVLIERMWENKEGNPLFILFSLPSRLWHLYNVHVNIICHMCFCVKGERWLYGCWFYRPTETFHLATRKFLEKEVFKGDYYNKVPISKVLGKCLVMFVKVRPHKSINLFYEPKTHSDFFFKYTFIL